MFKAGETNTLIEEFFERKRYKEIAAFAFKNQMIDMWFQYPNYGFLNEAHEVVVTNVGENYENLSAFGEYADPAQRALPFVVRAFDELRTVFLKRAESPQFTIPSYFGDFTPVKTYERFDDIYSEYLSKVRDDMISKSHMSKEALLQTVLANAKVFPITQSGFALSRHCPLSVTGLSLELSELPYDTDVTKGQLLQSERYKCFVEDAYNVGFYVDKNNPWRLVANLQSENMKKHILKYKEQTTAENILNHYFRRKTQYEDIQSVYKFFDTYGLTTEEVLSYTIRIRMAEVGMPAEKFKQINEEAQNIFKVYGNNYPSDPLKGSAAILGNYCSRHLKMLYEKKAGIDSFATTTLKDLT